MAQDSSPKMKNNLSATTASFTGGLTEDNQRFYMKPQQWIAARNATINTARGDLGDISNEPANKMMVQIEFPIIGGIHIRNGQWAIFSTDREHSNDTEHHGCEIGLFDETASTYMVIVRDCSLNFDQEHLIKGTSRVSQQCYRRIYWDDDLNPTRILGLDELDEYFYSVNEPVNGYEDCHSKKYFIGDGCEFTEEEREVDITIQNLGSDSKYYRIDTNKIRLNRTFKDLNLRLNLGTVSGELPNGTYCVFGRYLIDEQPATPFLEGSNLQHIFSHYNLSGSLTISVEADRDAFDYFQIAIFQFANGNFRFKMLGKYSTSTELINIDRFAETLPDLTKDEIKDIFGLHILYDHSKACVRLNHYMLRLAPTRKWDFPYQHQANHIQAHWAIIQRPWDYYRNGGNYVGYMRDEVYSFYIRFVFADGERSKSYHIPGRIADDDDLAGASTDTIQDDTYAGNPNHVIQRWEVYNTASIEANDEPEFTHEDYVTGDDADNVVAHGRMGYWESSEHYPDDNFENWGELCGKNIRHHKFPSNVLKEWTNNGDTTIKTNHYEGDKINILGVYFTGIEYPDCGIDGIVGYEILRASREGNKSILAKGMINNMRKYKLRPEVGIGDDTTSPNEHDLKDYYYPNYPYNPTKPYEENGPVCDHFLSHNKTTSRGVFNDIEGSNNAISIVTHTLSGEASAPGDVLNHDRPLGSYSFGDTGDTWPIGNISKRMLTFHSPDTMFRTPFLSAKELKVYGSMYGKARGYFMFPNNHPKHKFISDKMYLTALILGIGYSIVKMKGKKRETLKDSTVGDSGTTSGAGTMGVISSGSGMGPGLMPHILKTIIDIGKTALNGAVTSVFDDSILSTVFTTMGLKPHKWGESIKKALNIVSSASGGQGQEISVEHEESMFGSMPLALRLICGGTTFITYWAQGIDDLIELFYVFSNYRQHALQQVSHCFYDGFKKSVPAQIRRHIENASYVNPTFVNFDVEKVINNLHRSRCVALEINNDIDFPFENFDGSIVQNYRDDSQKPLGEMTDVSLKSVRDGRSSTFELRASSYYVALKQRITNQYGQITTLLPQIPITRKVFEIHKTNVGDTFSTPLLFGGDTYIGRYTEKNNMPFFYNWLNKQPDGTEFDYSKYVNIPFPRFWMNTEKFTSSDMLHGFDNGGDESDGDFNIYETKANAEEYCECGHWYMRDEYEFDGDDQSTSNPENQGDNTQIPPMTLYDLSNCVYFELYPSIYKKFDRYKTLAYYGNLAVDLLDEVATFFADPEDDPSNGGGEEHENGYTLVYSYVDPNTQETISGVSVEVDYEVTSSNFQSFIDNVNSQGLGNSYPHINDDASWQSCTPLQDDDDDNPTDPRCDVKYRKLWSDDGSNLFTNKLAKCGVSGTEPLGKTIIPRAKKLGTITVQGDPETGVAESGTAPSGPYKKKFCNQYMEGKGRMYRRVRQLQNRVSRWNKKANKFEEKIERKESNKRLKEMREARGGESFLQRLFVSPSEKFAFDRDRHIDTNRFFFGWRDSYMYLYVNGVRDFFVETTYNIDCRDWGETTPEQHYDQRNNTDLQRLFDMDYITKGNHMKIDRSLEVSRMPWEYHPMFGLIQDANYDKEDYKRCYTHYPNRIIYSLPMMRDEIRYDLWRVTPLLNHADFMSEPVNVKEVSDGHGIILLKNDSPVMITDALGKVDDPARNPLLLNNANILNSEYEYEQASCQNFYSAINTPAGLFYMNVSQGKIFTLTKNGPVDITTGEMRSWFDSFGDFKLIKDFPEFELTDNCVTGIGCQAVYNNETGIVYFIKIDYQATDKAGKLTYLGGGRFSDGISDNIKLTDKYYFTDASWTISYSPATKTFVSYHDWHPHFCFGSRNTFMTVDNGWNETGRNGDMTKVLHFGNGNAIWEHNERTDLYCNYYGQDYPFEVEIPFISKGTVDTLKNFMYYMEVYIYDKNGYDRFHVLDFNFDEAVVYNSEQCSGLLKLTLKKKNDPRCLYDYPKVNTNNIEILYSKEEQKYRFNQFYDIVRDRGEFGKNNSTNELDDFDARIDMNPDFCEPIWKTNPNGYTKELNDDNLDYNKFQLEHKRFRHYKQLVLLRRVKCGNKNMVLSIVNNVDLNSFR